jgi:hypothetical protein
MPLMRMQVTVLVGMGLLDDVVSLYFRRAYVVQSHIGVHK